MSATTDNTSTSIYNEATPLSSNVLYSGTYSNLPNPSSIASTAKLSFFTPDSISQSNSLSTFRSQITCIPDIKRPLVRTVQGTGGKTTKWGSSNALLSTTLTNARSYGFRTANTTNYITVSPDFEDPRAITAGTATSNWYIFNNFCSKAFNSAITSNTANVNIIGSTVTEVPFNKVISISTPTYGTTNGSIWSTASKTTMQTVSIENKNNNDISINLKMYLCGTTSSSGAASSDNNPYGIRINTRSGDLLNNDTNDNPINNNIYTCMQTVPTTVANILPAGTTLVNNKVSSITPNTFTLKRGAILDITLMKIVATVPTSINSSESSVLFIDLDSLIFTSPDLVLTSNENTYYYGNEKQMEFTCKFTPNNVINDNINGQSLKLNIYKIGETVPIDTITGTVNNGQATFNISDDNKYNSGNYKAIVNYYTTYSQNSNIVNNIFPDSPSHYNDGESNEITFTIEKQPITIEYNTSTLLNEYSILETVSFQNFKILDNKSIPANNEITLNGNFYFRVLDKNNNVVYTQSGTNFSDIKFIPKDYNLTIESTYKFNLTFTPNDPEILLFTTTLYTFKTELPLLHQRLIQNDNEILNPTLPYTTNILLECALKDTYGNYYDSSVVNGECISNFFTNINESHKNIDKTLVYDNSSKTYNITFSPQSLNLLRNSLINYIITTNFKVNQSIVENVVILNNNQPTFVFNGVELVSNIENINPNIYDSVVIKSNVKDKTNDEIYSISDVPGEIIYTVQNKTQNKIFKTQIVNSQNDDLLFNYEFIPNDLLINFSNNPLEISSEFVFSDSLIVSLNNSNTFNIVLITPTISITPKSEINDYHYGQEFDVELKGITNKNDKGALYLYGKSSNSREVAKFENVSLNNSYTFNDIDIDLLVEDDVLSTLQDNQSINGIIRWVPENSNAYTSIEDAFEITLSKTVTNFRNIVITNNRCVFTDTITITGEIASEYTEPIHGKVEFFNSEDLDTVAFETDVIQIDNLNKFTLNIVTDFVTSYNFVLKFVPTYGNVYEETTSDNVTNFIEFIKVTINPLLSVYDLNTQTSTNNNFVNMIYTNNFKIGIENMFQLDGTELIIQIGDDFTSEPLTITNGQVTTDTINFFSLNKTLDYQIDITQLKNIKITYTGYDNDSNLQSLYIITPINKNIQFSKNTTIPTMFNIYLQSMVTTLISTSLNFEEEFYINASLDLIKDSNNDIIPIDGKVRLYIGDTNAEPLIINENVTLENSQQIIVEGFKASLYDIFVGDKLFIFEFLPNDININSALTNPLPYKIISATITQVTLNLTYNHVLDDGTEVTYHNEEFNGSINFFNVGVVGHMNIYCKNPDNVNDKQLLSTISIETTPENKNTFLDFEFTCDAIKFDCPNGVTNYDIIVEFISGNLLKYSDNIMDQIFNYSISRIPIKISELAIDNNDYTNFLADYKRNVGDVFTVSGKIQTQNNEYIKGGKVELMTFIIASDDGNYYNIPENSLQLSNGILDPVTNTYYVNVNENGEFSCSILLTNLSPLYLYPGSFFQIIYRTNKNYLDKYFSYEDIPGVYQILVDNKTLTSENFKLVLDKSTLTNSHNFPYHEDELHFYIEINESYSYLSSASTKLRLFDVNTNEPIGNGNASKDEYGNTIIIPGVYNIKLLPLTKTIDNQTKTICYAELVINPKAENIYKNIINNYSAVCDFSATGYYSFTQSLSDSNGSPLVFNIEPTVAIVELECYSIDTNAIISSINYEESVNLKIKVRTQFDLKPKAQEYFTQDIKGSLIIQTCYDYGTRTPVEVVPSSALVFNSVENGKGSYNDGCVVKYTPKNNSSTIITDIQFIFAYFFIDSDAYGGVPFYQTKYSGNSIFKPFRIRKYTPTLETLSIIPVNDVTHEDPENKMDDHYVYYDDINNIKYNGFINFDEEFRVECSLNLNTPGTLKYYYSHTDADNSQFTEIEPKNIIYTGLDEQTNNNNKITAIFNSQLLQIPKNHVYFMKTEFTPTPTAPLIADSYNYTKDESPIVYFNIYQSNKFGTGTIFWDTYNNSEINKVRSYTSAQDMTILVSFIFEPTVDISEKLCEVTFYHTSFESSSNKFYGPIILDLTEDGMKRQITTTFTIPATTFDFKADPYSIRALFKPIMADNSKNDNYPVVFERNPLTLVIKPFITTDKSRFVYQYSDPISYNITLNSGPTINDITPYSKLVINIINDDSLTTPYGKKYEQSFTGTSVSFDNFQDVINTETTNLEPGNYRLSIYATNDTDSEIIKTEVFVTTFYIPKKDVTLSLLFDVYNLSYRTPNTIYLNIGNFPLIVGETNIKFTNVETNMDTLHTIKSADLTTIDTFRYKYNVSDISSWLKSGLYKVNAILDNKYYKGSQSDNKDDLLLVSKETNCSINLEKSIFDVVTGSDITIETLIKYNNSERITSGDLSLMINNGATMDIDRSFIVKAEKLNKDINNLVIYYNDSNYITKSLPFQINVTKQIANISQPTLTHNVNENTQNNFSLQLSDYNSNNKVTFYKLSSISKLVPITSSNGLYTFKFTDLKYGNNTIYAMVRSSFYDTKTTEVNVIRNKYDVTVTLDATTFNSPYKANSLVNIKYKVVKNNNVNEVISNNGVIEFHKVIYEDDEITINHDEIIGYVTVQNNIASISQHKLLGNSKIDENGIYYDNKIKFYAKFINSVDYNDSQTELSSLVIVKTKYNTRIIDNTVLTSSHRLGDTVELSYIVTQALENYSNDTSDENIKSLIRNEKQAKDNYQKSNETFMAANNARVTAIDEYNNLVRLVEEKSVNVTNATTNKNKAISDLNASRAAATTAKAILDAITVDKDQAELAFKSIQEVSKLVAANTPKSQINSLITTAKTEYDTALTNYETKLSEYNNILSEIATKESEVSEKKNIYETAETAYKQALLDLTIKENSLNSLQKAYEEALEDYNSVLENIQTNQDSIIELTTSISDMEDEYNTKKTDYETKIAEYEASQLVLPELYQNQVTAENELSNLSVLLDQKQNQVNNQQGIYDTSYYYQDSFLNKINSERISRFNFSSVTNIWAVIDQQSTSATPQNPFFVVYTALDNETSNAASWYKSKYFYGSNEGASVNGPMILYTGEDPVDIHPEITNRVKLEYNASLSGGLQAPNELVKTISIQTSSNMIGTSLNDYNFIFKEFGTIGTDVNANHSFIPTSENNTQTIYADGVKGTNVENGWSFNNNSLKTNGSMPKINWYLYSNKFEEYEVQWSIAINAMNNNSAILNTLKAELEVIAVDYRASTDNVNIVRGAYNHALVLEGNANNAKNNALSSYNTIKWDYEYKVTDKSMKESQLIVLKANAETKSELVSTYETQMNNKLVEVTAAKENYETKSIDYNSNKAINDTAEAALVISKNKLTSETNEKTIVESVTYLLNMKNSKYIIWESYVKYIEITELATNSSIDDVLSKILTEVNSNYDTKYSIWKAALNDVKVNETNYNTRVSEYNKINNEYNILVSQQDAMAIEVNKAWDNYYKGVSNWSNSWHLYSLSINNLKNVMSTIAITKGYIVFYKTVVKNNVSLVEVLGQIKPDSDGLAALSYKLVDLGEVKFHAKLVDLPDYYDSETAKISTTIFERFDTIVRNKSVLNSELYKIGDKISLSYSVVKTDLDESPVKDGKLAIYKKIGEYEQLLDFVEINNDNNGNITHIHTLTDDGSVSFYAKYIYSINNEDEIGFEQTIVVISKLNTQIEDISVSEAPYKLGNIVNLKYKLKSTNVFNVNNTPTTRTSDINEGTVEIHKCVENLDEVIEFVTLTESSNGIVDFNYELVDIGSVKFYIVYKGTKNYEEKSNMLVMREITVADKYTVIVTNNSPFTNPSPIVYKKLGDSITLLYNLNYNNRAVTEGNLIISKTININGNEFKETLGYADIDTNGNAWFTYKVVDVDCEVEIDGKFINSINYKELPSSTNLPIKVIVTEKYPSIIDCSSSFASNYKLGDSIRLDFNVTNNQIQYVINDGIISIHRVVKNTNQVVKDEILYYTEVTSSNSGIISFNYIIDTLDETSFYGEFNSSANYYDSKTVLFPINIVKEYTGAQNVLKTSNSEILYGNTIFIQSDLSYNSKTINEGNVIFYVTIEGKGKEIVGLANVTENYASISYTANDMGKIKFSSMFQNSSNYIDVESNVVEVNVIKNDIEEITFDAVSAVEFDVLSIIANINYGREDCYVNPGKILFTITNNNSIKSTIVDIINYKACYKLYVGNVNNYKIDAKFLGNDCFNESNNYSIEFEPIVNSNYKALKFVETLVSGTSNYYNIVAHVELEDNSVDEKFMLLNTGFVIFEAYEEDELKESKTLTVPLVNGTASAKVRKEEGYSYELKFVDSIINTKITVNGEKI